MTASPGQTYEYRRAVIPDAKVTVAAGLLPPMIAFVLVSGVTWSLLNGPVQSSAERCADAACAAPAPAARATPVAPKAASRPAPPPAVRGAPLRITVYDPDLEPLKIVPWDAQTETGPEAPPQTPSWVRLAAAEGESRGTCLMVADHRLACMTFPLSEAGSGGGHEG